MHTKTSAIFRFYQISALCTKGRFRVGIGVCTTVHSQVVQCVQSRRFTNNPWVECFRYLDGKKNYNLHGEHGSRSDRAQLGKMGVDLWRSHHRFPYCVFAVRTSTADDPTEFCSTGSYLRAAFANHDVLGAARTCAERWKCISLAIPGIFSGMRCAVFCALNPFGCHILFYAFSFRLAAARNLVSCFEPGGIACRLFWCRIDAVSVDPWGSGYGRPRCYCSCGNLVRCS